MLETSRINQIINDCSFSCPICASDTNDHRCAVRDLDPRPCRCKRPALPTELTAQDKRIIYNHQHLIKYHHYQTMLCCYLLATFDLLYIFRKIYNRLLLSFKLKSYLTI